MNNLVNDLWRKLVVPSYLIIQALITYTLRHLNISFTIHFGAVLIVSITYLFLAFKDPGYIDNQKSNEGEEQQRKTQGSIQTNEKQISPDLQPNTEEKKLDVIIQQKIPEVGELGINSSIKVEEKKQPQKINFSPPQEKYILDSHIIEGEIGLSLVVSESSGFVPVPSVLKNVSRHCSICELDQQLRVRHCIDCSRCVGTFDHHCPWINNCIGQKNKLLLIVFLFLQEVQLFGLAVDLILNIDKVISREAIVLWISVVAFGLVLLGVLFFHLYLAAINLTTWEKLRWYRIEYLLIFSKQNLRSLFDQGLCANLCVFAKSNFTKKPFDWKTHLNPRAHEFINAVKPDSNTERRLSSMKPEIR